MMRNGSDIRIPSMSPACHQRRGLRRGLLLGTPDAALHGPQGCGAFDQEDGPPTLRSADLVAVEHLIDTDSLAEESLVLTRCLQCINA